MLLSVFIFIIGLSLGSFLSVAITRLTKREKGLISGRSRCPRCHHQLAWYDLLPLLSFLLVHGSCRYCHKKISVVYPLIELTTAAVLSLYFYRTGYIFDFSIIFQVIFLLIFISIIFSDFLSFIIPDKIIIPAIGLALLCGIFFKRGELPNLLITGLVLGGIFAIIFIVSHGKWLGFGDVKLLILIGLLFGYPLGFLILLISIWIGALWGIGLMTLKRATMKTALPFGIFLSIVSIIFIIFHPASEENWLSQILLIFNNLFVK